MNSRQRKKHRGLVCSHLYEDDQKLCSDPVFYQHEEYCKIKDSDTMSDNGVEEYHFNYCLRCPHYNPSRNTIREFRSFMKECKRQPKNIDEELSIDLNKWI